ncbi:hypothetical protein SAMN04487846_3694 [Microbacterium sp. cf046]|nr:hypothetical protein SAMN04487846_3694 [Microbacterium sp. cf046]
MRGLSQGVAAAGPTVPRAFYAPYMQPSKPSLKDLAEQNRKLVERVSATVTTRPIVNWHDTADQRRRFGERAADALRNGMGSWGFAQVAW